MQLLFFALTQTQTRKTLQRQYLPVSSVSETAHWHAELPWLDAGSRSMMWQFVDLPFHIIMQTRDGMSGRDAALKQQFAEMAFFSRARTTGKMGEVVDKLKANLR